VDAGRAVFVDVGRRQQRRTAYQGPYAASKAALDTLVRSMGQRDREARNWRVNLFSPGPIPHPHARQRLSRRRPDDRWDTPEQAAEFIVPMCAPEWNETGKLYDYRTRTLMSFHPPA
jgi:NAD(P)-dependent dehydrogenase (short-subunit alcohol dehydrogenase family)